MQKGFTLIETILYVALFGIVMGGCFLAAFQLLSASGQVGTQSAVQSEESFVLRKVDWALGSIDPSKAYSPSSGSSNTLSLTRYDGTRVWIRLNSGKVELSEDGGSTYLPITTDNVSVSSLVFTYIAPSGTGPAGISAKLIINGLEASSTKYVRM